VTSPEAAPTPLPPSLPFRQILDEAVRQARRHFRRIYPYVAIPLVLVAGSVPLAQGLVYRDAFGGAAGQNHPAFARLMAGMGLFGLAMFAFMAVYALSYGAMFAAATDALAGREISMRRSWGLMARPRVFGTLVLLGLAVTVGFVFCVLPGLYLGLIYAFTVPVIVAESRFGTAALSRSAELARYNPQRKFDSDPRLHVFITVMVGTMLGYMINLLVQLPFIVYQQFVVFHDMAGAQKADPGEMMARLTWVQVPAQMLGMLTNTAVHLYVCFGLALLFFDLKSRKEGLDLEAAVASLVERHRARRQA
jgi:hypothetical protein